ncbi:MAG: dihydroorotate dehydrogenase electron transfer subunit [Deltaproteobacteria bacterium]|nr:dihydroorotate dehydrogenase electron transfer subunit [Deltaproteobacteria bacterium]
MGLRSPEIVADAKPGQFVMIRVGSGIEPLLRRPFSICGRQGNDVFLVLYRVVGKGTAIMAETEKGGRLSVLGPLGNGFELPKPGQTVVLVAGGIGVAPLFSLAQAVKEKDIQFMAGFGSSDEIIRMDPINDLNGINISFSTDDGTKGHAGLVTDLLDEYLKKNRDRSDSMSLFICGPLPMLKRVAAMALDHNISCHASLESAMACGLGACQGCAVRSSSQEKTEFYHVCKDGPVFPIGTIDWNSL